MKVGIVDYGMGNLYSIESAVRYVGCQNVFSVRDAGQLTECDKIILPGVGSYKKAIENLQLSGMLKAIEHFVIDLERPILGICLGMQLLLESSTEGGLTKGLGLVSGKVEKFTGGEDIKIPHVGFNEVTHDKKSKLFRNFKIQTNDFYFTHSYRVSHTEDAIEGTCFYGESFVATFEKNNIYGVQFHPELSQSNGILLLQNFIRNPQ